MTGWRSRLVAVAACCAGLKGFRYDRERRQGTVMISRPAAWPASLAACACAASAIGKV